MQVSNIDHNVVMLLNRQPFDLEMTRYTSGHSRHCIISFFFFLCFYFLIENTKCKVKKTKLLVSFFGNPIRELY